MSILIGAVIAVVLVALIVDGTHASVFGLPIKEKELDAYLGKYLDKAELNPYSSTMLSNMPRYVAVSSTVLSKRHIEKYGTIPRWSKWSKRLDKKRASLLPVPKPKKALSEL